MAGPRRRKRGEALGSGYGYSRAAARRICDWIADGRTLREFCRENKGFNRRTIQRWLEQHEDFERQWKIARLLQCDEWGDEILELADDSSRDWLDDGEGGRQFNKEAVMRSRLRVDTRKWLMAKRHPDYGDRLDLANAPGTGPLVIRWEGDAPAVAPKDKSGNGHAGAVH